MHDFLEGMRKLASAKSQLRDFDQGAEMVLRAVQRRTAVTARRQDIAQEDIKRGSRLTKHRISL